jgi:hypothetical protein
MRVGEKERGVAKECILNCIDEKAFEARMSSESDVDRKLKILLLLLLASRRSRLQSADLYFGKHLNNPAVRQAETSFMLKGFTLCTISGDRLHYAQAYDLPMTSNLKDAANGCCIPCL